MESSSQTGKSVLIHFSTLFSSSPCAAATAAKMSQTLWNIRQEQNTAAQYLPRLCTNMVINYIFCGQITVSVVFDSILLRQDQCEKKASAFVATDNNLTLIYLKKTHGACSPVWACSSQSKHFC